MNRGNPDYTSNPQDYWYLAMILLYSATQIIRIDNPFDRSIYQSLMNVDIWIMYIVTTEFHATTISVWTDSNDCMKMNKKKEGISLPYEKMESSKIST